MVKKMSILIKFTVTPLLTPTDNLLDAWVEDQTIITIESWELCDCIVIIEPAFPEQIENETDVLLKRDFEKYIVHNS